MDRVTCVQISDRGRPFEDILTWLIRKKYFQSGVKVVFNFDGDGNLFYAIEGELTLHAARAGCSIVEMMLDVSILVANRE